MRQRLWAFAVGLSVLMAAARGAAAAEDSPIDAAKSFYSCVDMSSDSLDEFGAGDTFRRVGLVKNTALWRRRLLSDTSVADIRTSFVGIDCNAERLRSFYGDRTGRQQSFINGGANLVLATASIAGLSAGAGATTVGYWTGASLTPGVLAQFYAYEPTRDLFRTGAAMSDFISKRHQEVMRDLAELGGEYPTLADTPPAYRGPQSEVACARLPAVGLQVSGWPEEDRAAILPEVTRLRSECEDTALRELRLQTFAAAASRLEARTARSYADNVLALDWQLHKQDQELRYTPAGAVSQFLASPFLLIGSVLSKDDAKSALSALKSQVAVSALKIDMISLDLPELPAQSAVPSAVTAQARGRILAKREAAKKPTQAEVGAVVEQLERTRTALVSEGPEYNRRLAAAQRLAVAGKAGVLTARFDASSRSITILFEDPAKPSTTTTVGSTASGGAPASTGGATPP